MWDGIAGPSTGAVMVLHDDDDDDDDGFDGALSLLIKAASASP